jgi:heme O synthase-like polyprenyltransferase
MRAYLQLLRPANIVTSLADVLAGAAIAYGADRIAPAWLLVSTACLYGGGVVLNDFFDRDLDARERPERPIPSGRVAPAHAAALGFALLAVGVFAAARVSTACALLAAVIAGLVLLYDAWAKRVWAGPVVMGSCRAFNLLLGMAVVAGASGAHWPIALLTFAHIVAVTTVSRGEVHGSSRVPAAIGLVLVAGVVVGLALLVSRDRLIIAMLMAAAFAWEVLPPFWSAWRRPEAGTIRNAVRAGVLALLVLDAALAAAFGAPIVAVVILVLAVVARGLSRLFAVT